MGEAAQCAAGVDLVCACRGQGELARLQLCEVEHVRDDECGVARVAQSVTQLRSHTRGQEVPYVRMMLHAL